MIPGKVYIIKHTNMDGTSTLSDAYISETDARYYGRGIVLSENGFAWTPPETFPDDFPMIPPLRTVWSVVEAFNWFMEKQGDTRRVEMLTITVREPRR